MRGHSVTDMKPWAPFMTTFTEKGKQEIKYLQIQRTNKAIQSGKCPRVNITACRHCLFLRTTNDMDVFGLLKFTR